MGEKRRSAHFVRGTVKNSRGGGDSGDCSSIVGEYVEDVKTDVKKEKHCHDNHHHSGLFIPSLYIYNKALLHRRRSLAARIGHHIPAVSPPMASERLQCRLTRAGSRSAEEMFLYTEEGE